MSFQYLYFLLCLKTIIEPAKPFMKLLGLQKHRAEETYRLMYFVVQTEVDDGLLLHNMTKEMVLLSQEEQSRVRAMSHRPAQTHRSLVPGTYER